MCVGTPSHIPNFCGNEPKRNADGTADGDTIFVRTDCATRAPLPNDQQDPVYQNPGVPLDRGVLAAIIGGWQNDTCDASYKFLFDSFEVKEIKWPSNELGTNGEGLEQQIKGCGDLTGWKFQWTPNDAEWEWSASGNLPIGTKACVGRAVKTAGGPNASVGGCSGAG